MVTGTVSRTLPFRCEQLFELAADIEQYPAYLPGWVDARIIERSGDRLRVSQQLGLKLLRHPFQSHAELDPPRRIHIHSDDGPFSTLDIQWLFEPDEPAGCQVSFDFRFALRSTYLEPMAGLLFEQTAPLIMTRFEQRAHSLYAG